MSDKKKYYVYVHKYASGPKEGRVFYVGKGKNKRHLSRKDRNRWWHSVVKKYGFTAHILIRLHCENCAFSFEKAFIRHYDRENLVNLTDGGQGSSGISDELRGKRSERMIGKSNPAYCTDIYEFSHEDHGVFSGTQYDFRVKYNLKQKYIRTLINGESKTYRGWWFGRGPKPIIDYSQRGVKSSSTRIANRHKLSQFTFSHDDMGIVTCSAPEFSELTGFNSGDIHRLIKGKIKMLAGWSATPKQKHSSNSVLVASETHHPDTH